MGIHFLKDLNQPQLHLCDMAAKVIDNFLPDLVTAISDCVQPMSDQCLAKGLIPESVYKRVLESGGTSEDKARTLVQAVQTNTGTDHWCLEILLDILEKQLPYVVKEKVLSEIRKEKANITQTIQLVPGEELPRESALLQSSLLGKFEDAIRQHERACAEKSVLEEKLKAKVEEHENLKQEFEASKNQTRIGSSVPSGVADRMTECEHEIEAIKARVSELVHTIEDQGMKVKRGRITAELNTEKMLAATLEKAKEEMRSKEQVLTSAIQEKDSKIKELELDAKRHKEPIRSPNVVPSDILKRLHIDRLRYFGFRDNKTSPFWRKLGSQLGFTRYELDGIERKSNKDKLFLLLFEYIQWYPGDRRGTTNFATYSAVQTALMNLGLSSAVHMMCTYNACCQIHT